MKQLSVAGKAITLLFATTLLVACGGSSSTKEADEAAAAAAAQAEADARAAEQRRKDRMAQEQEEARTQAAQMNRLKDAVMSVGSLVYFDFDSSALKPESQDMLDAHIALLKENSQSVRLEGHTDERGTREYNIALGERRANAVRDYLTLNGIASYRIETVSYGEEKPVAYGSGEANWSQNRRVELK